MAKINRENIADHLIDYQLGMIDKSTQEAYMTKEWYDKWTMTQEQHDEFKAYALPLLKKVFKCNKSRAEDTFNWFDLQFGLRVSDK
jgi:hypothetical protein